MYIYVSQGKNHEHTKAQAVLEDCTLMIDFSVMIIVIHRYKAKKRKITTIDLIVAVSRRSTGNLMQRYIFLLEVKKLFLSPPIFFS